LNILGDNQGEISMSNYLKAGYRLAVLLVLVFAAISLTVNRASARPFVTCQQTCGDQEESCFTNICLGLAHPLQQGCREECIAEFNDCLANCP
jgi:hypothetical protein